MEHTGHRERLRQRFWEQGLDGFAPHETLELLLTFAIPRADTNPIAHRLMAHFGSLQEVLQAHPQELMQIDGIGQHAATLVSLLLPVFRQYQKSAALPVQRLQTRQAMEAYCQSLFLGEGEESAYLLCLDARFRLLATEQLSSGTPGQVALSPRAIMRLLLRHHAAGAVITHNHPGASPQPSQADVDATCRLKELMDAVDVRLFDHIIVSSQGCCSLRQAGYLPPEEQEK